MPDQSFQHDNSGGSKPEDEKPAFAQDAARLLEQQHQDDGVHRMVLRMGGGQPPEDPDEQRYAGDVGDHVDIARQALAGGDLRRAIYHLSLALASDPGRENWLALLDQWIVAADPRALDLVPLDDPQYFGTLQASAQMMRIGNRPDHRMEVVPLVGANYHAKVAVHAYILAARGDLGAAVPLLLQLIQVKPEIPYVLWFSRWQGQPGLGAALDPDRVSGAVARVVQRYGGIYVFSEAGREDIARYLPLLRATFAVHPQHQVVAGMYSALLRKAGYFEEAVRVAAAAPPSYNTFVALAMGEAALGNQDACIAAYQRTFALDQREAAVRNDIGNAYLVQGKLAESLAAYEESTRNDPTDPFQQAFACAAYLKYLRQPGASSEWLDKLKLLAQTQQLAQHLLAGLSAPYIGKLPYASESFLNAFRNMQAGLADGSLRKDQLTTARLTCTIVESPSARLALQRSLDRLGAALAMTVERAPQPDTRQPLRSVEYQIWRYDGMDPTPSLPPPDPKIATQVAHIAVQPYALDLWHRPARALGERLGAQALMSLLGVMAYPPDAPDGWQEWDWIHAVQLASALTIAYIDAGWDGSRRKAALLSLIYGPMDWSGAAALVAMAVLARQDMRINIEFDRICLDLWHLVPDDGPWALEEALVYSPLFVGHYSEAVASKINAYFERLRQRREQSS